MEKTEDRVLFHSLR